MKIKEKIKRNPTITVLIIGFILIYSIIKKWTRKLFNTHAIRLYGITGINVKYGLWVAFIVACMIACFYIIKKININKNSTPLNNDIQSELDLLKTKIVNLESQSQKKHKKSDLH